MYTQKWLPANYWEYAAKHFGRVSRFVPTLKTGHSTPAFMIGAGNLDLSVKFPFAFGDFVAVRIPDAEKKWKFDMRRDLGIYLCRRYQERFSDSQSIHGSHTSPLGLCQAGAYRANVTFLFLL